MSIAAMAMAIKLAITRKVKFIYFMKIKMQSYTLRSAPLTRSLVDRPIRREFSASDVDPLSSRLSAGDFDALPEIRVDEVLSAPPRDNLTTIDSSLLVAPVQPRSAPISGRSFALSDRAALLDQAERAMLQLPLGLSATSRRATAPAGAVLSRPATAPLSLSAAQSYRGQSAPILVDRPGSERILVASPRMYEPPTIGSASYGDPIIRYSRHFKNMYGYDGGRLLKREAIPMFDRLTLRNDLRRLRSEILLLLDVTPRENLLRALEPDEDPDVESLRQDLSMFGFYNQLLAVFEPGWCKNPLKNYRTSEDDVDNDRSRVPFVRNWMEEPIEYLGDYSMRYRPGGMQYVYRANTPEEVAVTIPYSLSEEAMVDGIRRARKYHDVRGNRYEFALFHNLLAPFVFGRCEQ